MRVIGSVQYIFASIVGNPEKEKNVTYFVKLFYCVNEMQNLRNHVTSKYFRPFFIYLYVGRFTMKTYSHNHEILVIGKKIPILVLMFLNAQCLHNTFSRKKKPFEEKKSPQSFETIVLRVLYHNTLTGSSPLLL